MRGSVAKKIRQIVRPATQSVNDAVTTDRRFKTTLAGREIEFAVPVRTLSKTSLKFLVGKMKKVRNKLTSQQRANFLFVLARDTANFIASKNKPAAA